MTAPALAPWVEYLKRLPMVEQEVMLEDFKQISVRLWETLKGKR